MAELDEKILELKFDTESIQDNLSGWGPCDLPDTFKDMPYQPFSKSDRIGKICDWTNSGTQDKKFTVKYASVFGSAGQYAYYHDNDENSFHLVDTTKVQKPPHQRNRMRPMQRNIRGRGNRGGYQQSNMQMLSKGVKPQQRDRKPSNKKWGQGKPQVKNRESSVTVKNDWITVEEMDFPRLSKLTLPGVKEGETIVSCGELLYYDKSFDRVNVKNEAPLRRIDRIFHTVTTTDDPIIRKLSKTDIGNVFATDTILATIMCSTRSNYSWDIVIDKIGGKLFFDKRDNTEFDLLTVNETANEPPQEDASSINSPRSLALEATFINHNFSQQVLKSGPNDPRFKLKEKNPFVSEDEETEVASVAYYYKKWDLSNGITLVARCELDAVTLTQNGETQFLTIKALNEWDPKLSNGIDWRQKLDTQRGAVLANELRNNANKLAKWTVQALLAGCDQIKFGYVSRVIVRDANKHVILGTQQYKPQEFSTQINLNMDNAWGILRCIIDLVRKQKDGKYLIMKDPNKCIVRLYDIPDNTFDSESESSSDDEEQNAAVVA